jgi:hypothetical protein
MGRNEDGWSGEVEIDPTTYETVSESGNPETILGTGGFAPRDPDVIRLVESDDK